ncbi:MAG: DUF4249 domain-containing protein [Cyclobacteriaceae bacterium]
MKRLFILLTTLTIMSCEDEIFPTLNTNDPIIVVDAWVTNKPEPQTIRLTRTQDYFTDQFAAGIIGAQVIVTDEDGLEYNFMEQGNGDYVWEPTEELPTFGTSGKSYRLLIEAGSTLIESNTEMGRVPPIDSVGFRFEPEGDFLPDSYFADVWARDPVGPGDTYWIRTWKNGEYLSKPGEISLAYDAGFSAGGNVDGLIFIQPIRDSINPFDQDDNDDFLSPYSPGDSVYVEIHSLTDESYKYLSDVQIQTDRPGGFGELFATPLSNVGTNVKVISNSGEDNVIGFFNVAEVSAAGRFLDPNNLPGERPE